MNNFMECGQYRSPGNTRRLTPLQKKFNCVARKCSAQVNIRPVRGVSRELEFNYSGGRENPQKGSCYPQPNSPSLILHVNT